MPIQFLFVLTRLSQAIAEFMIVKDDIRRYNRADTVNMSPEEMNHFRHIAASAYFISKGFDEEVIELFGYMKEVGDFCRKFNWTDANFDINNNKTGISIGKKLRHANQKEIFDYIFKTEIEPKRNKLY